MPPLEPPDFDDDHHKRYDRGLRKLQAVAPQHLPHTIIMDIMRERAASRSLVSICPPSSRLAPGAPNAAPVEGSYVRRTYHTGDYTVDDYWWLWAVDTMWYDYRHACFVAEYMDQPPAYLSREFGCWAVLAWSFNSGRSGGDVEYARWLAWFHCASWKDLVASLESSADVAETARLLRWPPTLKGWYPPSWMAAPPDPPCSPQADKARRPGVLGRIAGAMLPSMRQANTSG